MVVHACKLSLWRWREEDWQFKVILGYKRNDKNEVQWQTTCLAFVVGSTLGGDGTQDCEEAGQILYQLRPMSS